ncbi:BNR/Asp-box repeat domain containing protein [Diplocarpon rosae]|nr:BNR/Asp-box repeat domain containing protein [Diplocarpon rosae]
MFGPGFFATVFALTISISPTLSAPSFEASIKQRAVTYKPVRFTLALSNLMMGRCSQPDWDFVSSVASGGEARPWNGLTPVWEPFLLMYGDHLVVYYSDQSDPEYGQKLCHKTSPDGVNWGPVVNDVAYPDYDRRPGMATIAEFKGHYILTYENGGGDSPSGKAYPIYYRISSNPLKFDSAPEHILHAGEEYLGSSPTVTWSSAGGENGTIIVSADSHIDIFTNTKLGDPSGWVNFAAPQVHAYSREVRVLSDPEWLLIIGAGVLNGNNFVSNSILKLPNL